jgi:hypothetical protein
MFSLFDASDLLRTPFFNVRTTTTMGQFYGPYEQYTPPIFAIPGNHDGEVDDPTVQTSLDSWVDYFLQANPDVDPISKDAPRVGLNLPNPYWTLLTPLATFVGMYTNVPEHGSIDSTQQQWLTNEFATAPDGPTPFIVSGNGGYHNLHQIHSANGTVAADTKAKLIYGKVCWGSFTLTIDKKSISGQSTEIDRTGKITTPADTFSYPIDLVIFKNPKSVPTL